MTCVVKSLELSTSFISLNTEQIKNCVLRILYDAKSICGSVYSGYDKFSMVDYLFLLYNISGTPLNAQHFRVGDHVDINSRTLVLYNIF